MPNFEAVFTEYRENEKGALLLGALIEEECCTESNNVTLSEDMHIAYNIHAH